MIKLVRIILFLVFISCSVSDNTSAEDITTSTTEDTTTTIAPSTTTTTIAPSTTTTTIAPSTYLEPQQYQMLMSTY